MCVCEPTMTRTLICGRLENFLHLRFFQQTRKETKQKRRKMKKKFEWKQLSWPYTSYTQMCTVQWKSLKRRIFIRLNGKRTTQCVTLEETICSLSLSGILLSTSKQNEENKTKWIAPSHSYATHTHLCHRTTECITSRLSSLHCRICYVALDLHFSFSSAIRFGWFLQIFLTFFCIVESNVFGRLIHVDACA